MRASMASQLTALLVVARCCSPRPHRAFATAGALQVANLEHRVGVKPRFVFLPWGALALGRGQMAQGIIPRGPRLRNASARARRVSRMSRAQIECELAHRHVVRKTDTIRHEVVDLYPSCVRA